MLARQLRHHPAWTAAELAAVLAAARDRLALMHAENLSVAAAFDLSCADLTAGQQRLFRRLGLIPGPSFDAYAALDGITVEDAGRRLEELYDQHLLAEPAPGRYNLHDLVREHARALAAADDPAGTGAATGRLLDYYLHAAAAAGGHFSSWVRPSRRPPPGRPPADLPGLSAVGPAADWLEAERANLHAVSAGRTQLLLLRSDGSDGIPELVQQRGEHLHIAGLPVRDEQGEPVQAGPVSRCSGPAPAGVSVTRYERPSAGSAATWT
jgi:hypothetical protein